MSETADTESSSASHEKPVILNRLLAGEVQFPPFPEPTEEEFEEDIGDDERNYYRHKFADLDVIKTMRLHCSACDRHLGSSTRNESRMRAHPMLRTLVCHTCHTFYNSGEFEKGDDGSELYCRWCGQGGQVYCCSDCPHVFCAKCIKRNLGNQKIKEIENADDWKCFKCNPKCLWDLRAICWALLRYCDMKNKITYKTEDPVLKEAYQKDCAVDHTECCKSKTKKRDKETLRKKEDKKPATPVTPKMPSTIQVKKFASINLEEPVKEKKAPKRPAQSNENKVVFIKNPIAIAPKNMLSTVSMPPAKKPRMPLVNTIRFVQQERKQNVNTYARIRPKIPTMPIPIIPSQFNGFNMNNNTFQNFGNMVPHDTLNLSLESLTQGLDMAAVAAMNSGNQDDDVVCTPDFPLEPLCEVTEDNTDDDVQCITPAPVTTPKVHAQTGSHRVDNVIPDLSNDNIVQMTDNDVTVNALTGGLKFRVDPQTLSSNKMYRLPDGRIFAIKANPNMPGGYSATIVAVTDTGLAKTIPKGATYAAKLSAVTSSQTSTSTRRINSSSQASSSKSKRDTPKSAKVTRGTDTSTRECDLNVPVEWYRYNLVDAVDALEYSLHRLYKLKKEATCRYLRTRTLDEMKSLHKTLDRLLNTSATRFNEIKESLNKELKQYIVKKTGGVLSDDDDDVEILPDVDDNDDPIFIDENSVESNPNDLTCHESQEVDLTGVGSSDHNDSTEMMSENISKVTNLDHADDSDNAIIENSTSDPDISVNNIDNSKDKECPVNNQENTRIEVEDPSESKEQNSVNDNAKDSVNDNIKDTVNNDTKDTENAKTDNKINDKKNDIKNENLETEKKVNGSEEQESKNTDVNDEEKSKEDEKKILADDNSNQGNDAKLEDSEMSEEMIENLLKEDTTDETESILNTKPMEVVESI